MNRMRAISLLVVLGVLHAAGAAWADIPVPDPQTVWARNAQPSSQSIAYAGVLLSAAVITAGLIVARWPARGSRVGLVATGVLTVVGVLAIAVGALAAVQQAERDRAAWNQWEIDENTRRSNWRGPPRPDEPPPPSLNPDPTSAPPAAAEPPPSN